MKRTPLRRRKQLSVNHAMRRHSRSTKYARRERAFSYMGWVKRQMCIVARAVDELHSAAGHTSNLMNADLRCCSGIEADHAGRRGMGQKSPDRDCIPLCTVHHRQRTDYSGIFKGFTAAMMRAWADRAIAITHELAKMRGIEVPLV